MATYKVIQDIEAEDKLVGPLTLRQFIYAGVALVCFYFCFLGVTKGAPFLLVIFLPIALLTGFFAFPWGREQPTELWALAKVRYAVKPRKRIWDKSGVREAVTITVPKKIDKHYSDGLSKTEVNSRLKALADTIDSRGWAIKNVNVNLSDQPSYFASQAAASSDRLVDASSLPQEVSSVDVQAADDMLDEDNNPIAQQFEELIQASSKAHRKQVIQEMSDAQTTGILPAPTPAPVAPAAVPPQPAAAAPPADYWFLDQPQTPGNQPPMKYQIIAPGTPEDELSVGAAATPTEDERAFAENLRRRSAAGGTQQPYYGHLHVVQPLSQQQAMTPTPVNQAKPQAAKPAPITPPPAPQPPVTRQPDPAIIALASNNDLDVATIARQAKKQEPPDEVIISLH